MVFKQNLRIDEQELYEGFTLRGGLIVIVLYFGKNNLIKMFSTIASNVIAKIKP